MRGKGIILQIYLWLLKAAENVRKE
jgi:hypothetical protein